MTILGENVVCIWIVKVPTERTGERARATLMQILAHCLAVKVNEVALVTDEHGKPRLAGGELEFNVSHSGDLAVVGIAHMPVGIDIERVEDIEAEELADVAVFVLSERERQELARLPEGDRLLAYYRTWTRKEAYVKATGEGITGRPLPEIELEVDATPPRLLAVAGLGPDELVRWSFVDLDPPKGYVGAIVVAHPRPHIALRVWEPSGHAC